MDLHNPLKNKFFLLYCLLCFSPLSAIADTVFIPKSLNFKYNKPVSGIQISGTWYPDTLNCMQHITGKATITFTRLSDHKHFSIDVDGISLAQQPQQNCTVDKCILPNKTIIKQYVAFKDALKPCAKDKSKLCIKEVTPAISFYTFDKHIKNNIIIATPCGQRFYTEFTAYNLINTNNYFGLSKHHKISVKFDGLSQIDPINKTISLLLSGGWCDDIINTYQAGNGYYFLKSYRKLESDAKRNCYEKIYSINKQGKKVLLKKILLPKN